ncbi:MAG: FG-GAP-like repeat-containing protein [Bacteroidota bacterium]
MFKHVLSFVLFSPFLLFALAANCQSFTKITDINNPIVADSPTGGYAGASWIDYDNDDDLDLFVNAANLFRNEGNGVFTEVQNSGITGSSGLGNGNTWGDFNNDGHIDVYLANSASKLFMNNGDGTFSHVNTGDIGGSVNGWAAAFGDYNNDSFIDLVITHPCGFIGTCHANYFFENNGDGTFDEITGTDVTTGNAAYTVANWSDYDMDGDIDLFIGSGEVGFTSKDHIYINLLTENGSAELDRLTGVNFADDLRDGQNWNWIDYDNDRDLDGFVTNYNNNVPNNFYRNDNGTFVKLTNADVGAGMVSTNGPWLTNLWGDFDNDGDLDAVVTNDGGFDRMYSNNGDGTFTTVSTPFSNIFGTTRGATAGDYDNDGFLDLYIHGPNNNLKGLYNNDGNSNSWVNLCLEGTVSNRSALGARVHALANVNGNDIWQLREITAQSSFDGMNSLRVHFGLGNATIIDSLVIEWPSGMVEEFSDVQPENFYKAIEGQGFGLVTSLEEIAPSINGTLRVFPNPTANSELYISYKFDQTNDVYLDVYTLNGKRITGLSGVFKSSKEREVLLNTAELSQGTYIVTVQSGGSVLNERLVILY